MMPTIYHAQQPAPRVAGAPGRQWFTHASTGPYGEWVYISRDANAGGDLGERHEGISLHIDELRAIVKAIDEL